MGFKIAGHLYLLSTRLWYLTAVLCSCVLQVLHLAAVLAPNEDLAYMTAIVWTAINLLFSGFYVNTQDLPFRGLAFLEYITVFYFALEGLMTIEFQDRTLTCSDGVLPPGVGPRIPQLLPHVLARPEAKAGLDMLLSPTPDCIADPTPC